MRVTITPVEAPKGQRRMAALQIAADLITEPTVWSVTPTFRPEHGGWCVKVVWRD